MTLTLAQSYRLLTKPGIIMGNAVTAAGGFALASKAGFDFTKLLLTLAGLSLIIASAGVFNNYIDRSGDEKMARTKDRASALKIVTTQRAMQFAIGLILLGAIMLIFFVNPLTASIALFGFFFYVAVYSFAKYHTSYATLIGSVAGSVPPLVGYCGAGGSLDLGAWLLFFTVAIWQMPHFFAIAIYRIDDYAKASIPVLPIVKGIRSAKVQMFFYILLFMGISSLLTVFHYTGNLYLVSTLLLGSGWLALCVKGFTARNDQVWAKSMFLYSLIVITLLCLIIPMS